jgi:Protein of unknown function (DUF2752)
MQYLQKYSEILLWSIGLLYLAFVVNPDMPNFSFCVFKMMGIDSCWGCGLGRSIAYLFDGNLKSSFQAHPLGIFATFVLLHRIFTLR